MNNIHVIHVVVVSARMLFMILIITFMLFTQHSWVWVWDPPLFGFYKSYSWVREEVQYSNLFMLFKRGPGLTSRHLIFRESLLYVSLGLSRSMRFVSWFVCLLLQGWGIVEDMCYERRRAEWRGLCGLVCPPLIVWLLSGGLCAWMPQCGISRSSQFAPSIWGSIKLEKKISRSSQFALSICGSIKLENYDQISASVCVCLCVWVCCPQYPFPCY